MNRKRPRETNFRSYLQEEGILEEVEARAMKHALTLQLGKLIEQKAISKTEMAARMKTSRAAVDRLLDDSNTSITLTTLGKAAHALGQKLKIEMVPA